MELRNKPYRAIPLGRIILCKLYQRHVNDDPQLEFSAKEIVQMFSQPVSYNLVVSALEIFRGRTHNRPDAPISRHKKNGSEEFKYRLTYDGLLLVEKNLADPNSDIYHFFQHGDRVLDDIAGIDSLFVIPQEKWESDPWSPLPIDRADPRYTEAVTDVENALEVVRGDNGFAATHPNEREGILSTLEDGLRWLKERTPNRSQIFSLLVAPLQWLASNFSKAVIGEAAKKAAQSVLDLLHTVF
jgi:hypothetical protein